MNNLSHAAYLNQRNWLATLFLGAVAPHVGIDYLKVELTQSILCFHAFFTFLFVFCILFLPS
jgi:hypothetical protein